MDVSAGNHSHKLRKKGGNAIKKISGLIILAGLLVAAFPFLTEVYGSFKAVQLKKEWERQESVQLKQAQSVRQNHDRLIAAGSLPMEAGALAGSSASKVSGGVRGSAENRPFPKTRITIPKIGLEQIVLEGTTPDILKLGPGHYTGTANPGEKGNVGIAGHRVTYTHPFNRLDELVKGDLIILETYGDVFEYEVESVVVVDPKDVSTLQPTPDPRVTLTTCNPKYSAKTRLNVIGVLVNANSKKPSVIQAIKDILAGDSGHAQRIEDIRNYEELHEVLEQARRAAEKNPSDAAAYILLAESYMALGRYPEAIRELKNTEKIKPDLPEIKKLYSSVNSKKEELVRQILNGEKGSVGQGGLDPAPYFDLGRIYLELGDYQKAADVFDKGIGVFPNAADMHAFRAKAYEKLKLNDIAIEAYGQSLKFDPEYTEALNGMKRLEGNK